MAAVFTKLKNFLISSENAFLWHLGFRNKPDAFAAAICGPTITFPASKFSFNDILNEAFLWAVPKHRRTIWKRRTRRFGTIDGFYKMIQAKSNLVSCTECGEYKEAGRLCRTCYDRIILETQDMQNEIQKNLGLSPVDKEVVVLYENELPDASNEFYKGKRIVEIKKNRPSWFCKNLLQKTTQAPATTAAVEPKDLA